MKDKNCNIFHTCLSYHTLAHKLSTELSSIFSPTWAVLQHPLCDDSGVSCFTDVNF